MAAKKLEPHDLCPGGTGKPIRDCGCRPILSSIDAIVRAIDGKQYRAARDQVERLIKKEGRRPCLVTYHMMILTALNERDTAIESLREFLDERPHFSPSLSRLAVLSTDRPGHEWADYLVQAFEHAENAADLQNSFNGARAGCPFLKRYPAFLAAVAWADVVMRVLNEEQTREFFQEVFSGDAVSTNAFALITSPIFTSSGRSDGAGASENEAAGALLRQIGATYFRGKMETAHRMTQKALTQFPDDLRLWGMALRITAARDRTEATIELLRDLAEKDFVGDLEKVWFESIAQLETNRLEGQGEAAMEVSFVVSDAREAMERLDSHEQIHLTAGDSPWFNRPTKAMCDVRVLDGPAGNEPITTIDEALERARSAMAVAAVFAKTTSRPAEVALIVVDTFRDQVLSVVRDALGDLVEGEECSTYNRVVGPLDAYAIRQWFTRNVDPTIRREAESKLTERWIMEQWPDEPHRALGGKTPVEAAEDPSMARQVAAAVWNAEVFNAARGYEFDFNSLRKRLGIPEIPTVDPWETNLATTTVIEWMYIDMVKISAAECVQLFSQAAKLGHRGVMKRCARALEEIDAESPVTVANVCVHTAQMCDDPLEEADWFGKAAQWLEKVGDTAPFDARLREAMALMSAAAPDRFADTITKLLESPMTDEQRTRLMAFLEQIGLLDSLLQQQHEQQIPVSASEEGIAQEDTSPQPSKLWMPGDP